MNRMWSGSFVIGASGFIALSYELLWYRIASFAASSTVAVFPLLLGCYLLGIAFGSLFADRVIASGRDVLRATSIALLVSSIAGAVAGAAFGFMLTIGSGYYIALLVFALGALALGLILPLLTEWAVSADTPGVGVSYLYASNIVGSVAGTILTGFVLLDMVTLATMTAILCALGISLFTIVSLSADSKRRIPKLAGSVVLIALSLWLVPKLYDGIWSRLFYWEFADEKPPFAEVYEARGGVAVVTPDGRALSGGVYDGTFSIDLVHDKNGILRAFAGPMIHPAPKRVLCIGLATGSWATVLANAPGVEELTIVEIEHVWPKVIEKREPHRKLLTDEKVTWVFDDARRWLNANPDAEFDLIVANVSYNWRSHSSLLLSEEYLALVSDHLTEDGVYLYNSTDSPRVWATAIKTFPHVARVFNAAVLSKSEIVFDQGRWRSELSKWQIYGEPVFDLSLDEERIALDKLVTLAGGAHNGDADSPLETLPSLRRLADFETITDDNMGEEWTWTIVPRSYWLGGTDKINRWEE